MIWKTQTHWQKGKFFKQSYFPLSLTFTRMKIWLTLCVTWLCPSIGLTFLDIFFDSLLAIEYYAQWQNVTYVNKSIERFVLLIDIKHSYIIIRCQECREVFRSPEFNTTRSAIHCFEYCFTSEARLGYTLFFLLLPVVFYLSEFLTLTDRWLYFWNLS